MVTKQKVEESRAYCHDNGGDFRTAHPLEEISLDDLIRLFPEKSKKLFNLIPIEHNIKLVLVLRKDDMCVEGDFIRDKYKTNINYVCLNALDQLDTFIKPSILTDYSTLYMLRPNYIDALAIANTLKNGFVIYFYLKYGTLNISLATSSAELAANIFCKGSFCETPKHMGEMIGYLIEDKISNDLSSLISEKPRVLNFIFQDIDDSIQNLSSEKGVFDISGGVDIIIPVIR